MGEAIDHLGFNEQDFMMMYQTYMQNPQYQQDLMQAQMMPNTPEGQEPKLTKQQTKELFYYSEEKKMESMQKIMVKSARNKNRSNHDPMEQMFEMMIEQSKLADNMYFEKGVEEEEFNAAILHYNLLNDPEIQKKMMESMQKLQMQGGFGAFG